MKQWARRGVILAGLGLSACAPAPRQEAPRIAYNAPAPGSFGLLRTNVKIGRMEETLVGAEVSKEFFESTRVTPVVGRLFVDGDFSAAAEPVIIIHHEIWQARVGGHSAAVGRRIGLDGREFTIIGVAPLGYNLPDKANYWLPRRPS